MGVRLVNLAAGQTLVAIARNAEEPVDEAGQEDVVSDQDGLADSAEVADPGVGDSDPTAG